MIVEKGVYARMIAVAGLTNLVPVARIFHEVIDQAAAYPQIAYSRVSTMRHPAMGANAGVATARIQINSYADTALGALEVSEQVRAALSRWNGTAGGVVIQAIFDESEHSDYDADIGKHRVITEFIVWYEE